MAAFDHITRAYEILASDSLLRNETSPTNNIDGISIEIFKSILRAHSWRFNGIKGIRKPKFSSDPVFYQDRQNNQEVEFELDFNILLLVLWHKFKTCHNSELCSAQYENPFPLSNPKIWTDKWKEKFDVPADISLIDVSVVEDSSAVESIKKLIGGCSCYCGGPFTHSNIVGGRIPREMFIQFFLVTILREDSELFDLASVAIPQATRNSMLDTEFEDSKLSSFSMSLLDPTDSMNLDASPNKRNPILKRKSRRFFTAVTDVFQSPIVRPIYFNEGWRQCWLASRFLYREHPPEYIEFSKSKIFDIHWWKVLFERIIGSQEFDIITDALFATAMVIFIGFAPSVGLMIVWIIYALIETTLRLSFKGLRRSDHSSPLVILLIELDDQ